MIRVEEFGTEYGRDILTFRGPDTSGDSALPYLHLMYPSSMCVASGYHAPNGMQIQRGDMFQWETDNSTTQYGWRVCISRQSPPAAAVREELPAGWVAVGVQDVKGPCVPNPAAGES